MIKYLLSDEDSLWRYVDGQCPSIEDVKRRLIKVARKVDYKTTDNQFFLKIQMDFEGKDNLSDVLTKGLFKLADDLIDSKDGKLFTRPEMQNYYQEHLPYITPLLLQAAKISFDINELGEYRDLYKKHIYPNNRFTSILSPNLKALNSILEDKVGLFDLHIHLNGSMETDYVWQEHLARPAFALKSLEDALKKEVVKTQFEQESFMFNATKYYGLLLIAKRIRRKIYELIVPNSKRELDISPSEAIHSVIDEPSEESTDYLHPFLPLITEQHDYKYLMSIECLMYVLVLKNLELKGNNTLATLFHFYLLILGLANRLLVYQEHQHGLRQFQMHSVNKLREKSEEHYVDRFLQFQGNDLRLLHYLEGRFAPTEDFTKTVSKIYQCWHQMEEFTSNFKREDDVNTSSPLLKLVAHFIKDPEKSRDADIRHKALRMVLSSRAKKMSAALRADAELCSKIVGLDAASNEFDAPPEVFAPAFRNIDRDLIKRRTFHAGEDFHHVISGLRTIFEAITFCDLSTNDRIGHAVAAGISTKMWVATIGSQVLISKGEYLDNLIFTNYIITKNQIASLYNKLELLKRKADELLKELYGDGFSINDYEKSWLIRDICPLHASFNNEKQDRLRKHFSQIEWDYIIDKNINKTEKYFKLFVKYHENHYRKLCDEIISINTEDILNRKDLKLIQLAILDIMFQNKIIIETLPTSNVRIGIHRDYSTYHIARWIKWKDKEFNVPEIVVGTDDTGIFATNIYNEYANIYCYLNTKRGWTEEKSTGYIKELNENSNKYKFG